MEDHAAHNCYVWSTFLNTAQYVTWVSGLWARLLIFGLAVGFFFKLMTSQRHGCSLDYSKQQATTS